MTGIGGDAFCLYYDATLRTVRGLNGSGRSPAGLTLAAAQGKVHLGYSSVVVEHYGSL